ncbi:MAG: hypothetical protein VW420_00070 [Schleiferiaceae bacterium]
MGAQAKDIASWLKEDAPLASPSDLAEAIEQHPYASILHFAYLRALQNEDSYKFPAQLHRTALSAMDRQALLDWAESPLIPVEVQAAAWKEAQKPASAEPSPEPASSSAAPVVSPSKSSPESAAPVSPKAVQAPKPAPQAAPTEASAPKSASAPVPTPAPTPVKPADPKPAAATDLSNINLDALPPAVRDQILRSRAIQEKMGKAPVVKPALAPEKKAATAPVETAPSEPKVDVPATHAQKEVAPQTTPASTVPAPTPVPAEPVKAVPSVQEEPLAKVPEPEKTAEPKPLEEKPKEAAPKPSETVGAVPAPDVKTFTPDPSLSPFANFLAGLKDESAAAAVPDSQRDPAMERAILEQFLEINPKIKPVRDAPLGENLALRTPNVSGLVTETLANHYYDQGMHEKAIQAYEILKLKVPEKSVIFAARISEMRKSQSSTK